MVVKYLRIVEGGLRSNSYPCHFQMRFVAQDESDFLEPDESDFLEESFKACSSLLLSFPPSLPPSVPFPLSPSPSHTLSITNTNTNTHFGHPMDVPLALWDKHRSLALARILLLSLYRVLPRARARSLSLFLSPSVNYLLILIIAVRLESSKQLKEAPPVCNLGGGNANQRNCGVLSCMPFVSQWLISLLHIRSCNSAFTLVHTLRVRGNRSMRKEADVVMQE